MKTLRNTTLSVAFILSLLAAPAVALAQTGRTFGDTPQSKLVQTAMSSIRAGDVAAFRKVLSDQAQSRFGSEEGLQRLQGQFERLSRGTAGIELSSPRKGTWVGDEWGLSLLEYDIAVLGHRGNALEPIWTMKVECRTLSVLEHFGSPEGGCKITRVSIGRREGIGSPAENAVSGRAAGTKDDASMGESPESSGGYHEAGKGR